jgi:hemoglobin-like flavoprotein
VSVYKHPLCDPATRRALADVPDDGALIRRLELSFARLGPRAALLAERFVQRVLREHPELAPLLGPDLRRVQRRLASGLSLAVAGLRDVERLCTALREQGRDLHGAGVRAAHFPVFAVALVATLADLAGRDWSDDLQADWHDALLRAAALMQPS